LVKSREVTASGGVMLGHKSLTARQWLTFCGVPITRGKVILYKSLNKDFTSRDKFQFAIGQRHDAPDWDAEFTGECGKGIHYCPTVAQARRFRDEGTFVACEVRVRDMAGLPAFAEYPDKIRAKGGTVIYQCDENGEQLKERDSNG
jgi:hypothetical protein